MRCSRGSHGKAPGPSGGRGSKGKAWARAFIVVSVGGRDKVGEVGLGLASMNNVRRDRGAVPCCLAPGPGLNRAGGDWP